MDKENNLAKQLEKANRELGRLNSTSYQFYISLVRGIGTAVGVTLIGGLLIGILNSFIHSIYDIPILGKIVAELRYIFPSK